MNNINQTKKALWFFIGLLGSLLLLALAWRYVWDTNGLTVDKLKVLVLVASSWHGSWWLWPLVVVVFVVLLLLMFPLTILVVLTGLLYGPWWGFCYATLGTLASSVVSYEVGRLTGTGPLIRFGGKKLLTVSKFIGERGVSTMIIINLLPLAPFTLTNIMAGASHIRFWPYLLGSAIGIIPGLALVNFAGSQLNVVMHNANSGRVATSVGIVVVIVVVLIIAPRRLKTYLQKRNEKL